MVVVIIYSFGAAIGFAAAHAQAERYDPVADPNVQTYLICIQVGSGGADNSLLPNADAFDAQGYVQWRDGTGKALFCQVHDKAAEGE